MKLAINPEALTTIRRARGYSEGDLAGALALTVKQIRSLEAGDELPTKTLLTRLCALFYVPYSIFFSSKVSLPNNIADFRTPRNAPARVGKGGIKQITQCIELQDVLAEVIPRLDLQFFATNIRLAITDDVEDAAHLISSFLNLERAEFFSKNDPVELFSIARRLIETKKIAVITHRLASETFRGFCLAERLQVPLIFINNYDQTPKTKLFTLIHELTHVFIRRDGVSDPFGSDTIIEQFCNRITARVLMPERRFRLAFSAVSSTKNPVELTRLLSGHLGLSLHAIAMRVDELNLRAGFYEEWRRIINSRFGSAPLKIIEDGEEDEDETEEEDYRRPSSARRLLTRFGYRIPSILNLANDKQVLSPLDAERLLSLSTANLPRAAQIAAKEFRVEL